MIRNVYNVVLLEALQESPCKKLITNFFPDCRILKADIGQEFIIQYILDCGADLVFIDQEIENVSLLIECLVVHRIYTVWIGDLLHNGRYTSKKSDIHFYLNPADLERSRGSIQQIYQMLITRKLNQKIDRLTNTLSHLHNLTLSISSKQGFEKINILDILRIEADRSYCTVHYFNQEKILISRPLNAIEKRLPPGMFLRIHSAHLVNVSAIMKYKSCEGHSVVLENGQKVPLASRRKELLLEYFKSI